MNGLPPLPIYCHGWNTMPIAKTFLLDDGMSMGALFEVDPVGCEARTPDFMARLRDAIQTAINEALPELDDAPWILQVYVQDEPSLDGFYTIVSGIRTAQCKINGIYTPLSIHYVGAS